jgi:hypothetical protein
MSFLRHRGRLLIEAVGITYAFLMVLLAIVEWAGDFAWRLAPSSLLTMAGVSFMGAIYLALDEIRLNTRK